jgi:hypothetical protein
MKCFRSELHGGAGHKVGWIIWLPDGWLRLVGRDCGERHLGIDRHRVAVDHFKKIDSAEQARELRAQQLSALRATLPRVVKEVREVRNRPECVYHAKLIQDFARDFPVEKSLIFKAFERDRGEMFIERRIDERTRELMSTGTAQRNANQRDRVGPIQGWGAFLTREPVAALDDALSLLQDIERRSLENSASLSDDEQTAILRAARTALQRAIEATAPLQGAAMFLSPSNSSRLVKWFTAHDATAGRAEYATTARGFSRTDSDGELFTAELPEWFETPKLVQTRNLEALLSGRSTDSPRRSRQMKSAA